MINNNKDELRLLRTANILYQTLTKPMSKNISHEIPYVIILFIVGVMSYILLQESALIGQALSLPEQAYFIIHSALICSSFLMLFSPFLVFNEFYRNVAFTIIIGTGCFFAGYSDEFVKKHPEAYMDYGNEISHVSRKKVI